MLAMALSGLRTEFDFAPPPKHVSRLFFSTLGGPTHFPVSTLAVYNFVYPELHGVSISRNPPKTQ